MTAIRGTVDSRVCFDAVEGHGDDRERVTRNAWSFAFRVARKRFHLPPEDAEDIAQEVSLLAARQADSGFVTPAWIVNGVLYRCVDLTRKRASEERALAAYAEEQHRLRQLDEAHDVILQVEITRAIESLPPRCRELLRKYFFEQKTWAEIDAELGTGRCAQYRTRCCVKILMDKFARGQAHQERD